MFIFLGKKNIEKIIQNNGCFYPFFFGPIFA